MLRTLVGLALLATLLPQAAGAAENDPVSVKVNMARVLRISTPAATVIVGNPGVADVTIQDPQTLVLTGRSYGQTNLIILDVQGNPIADTVVEVIQAQSDVVTVYMGERRTSVSCSPVCQPIMMIGDDAGYTAGVASSSQAVSAAAAAP
jgi:Flp pilus assembly secretin CpaC